MAYNFELLIMILLESKGIIFAQCTDKCVAAYSVGPLSDSFAPRKNLKIIIFAFRDNFFLINPLLYALAQTYLVIILLCSSAVGVQKNKRASLKNSAHVSWQIEASIYFSYLPKTKVYQFFGFVFFEKWSVKMIFSFKRTAQQQKEHNIFELLAEQLTFYFCQCQHNNSLQSWYSPGHQME